MPPIQLKRSTPKLSLEDSAAINEVLIRCTTSELPEVQLPSNCSAMKDQWLAAFREAVIKKVEEHCISDDSLIHSTVATSKEDAATMQRIESLNAQMLVLSERVKDVKQRVLGSSAAKLASRLEKKRKFAERDVDIPAQVALPVPIPNKTISDLQAAAGKAAGVLAAVEGEMARSAKMLQETLAGVDASVLLQQQGRANGSAGGGGKGNKGSGSKDDSNKKQRKQPTEDTASLDSKARFTKHLTSHLSAAEQGDE